MSTPWSTPRCDRGVAPDRPSGHQHRHPPAKDFRCRGPSARARDLRGSFAELAVGPLVAASEEERARRQVHLQEAEAGFDPLPFDAAVARAFGRVAASLRRAGRKPAARAYDALIAATALANGLPLYTVNPSDFLGIDDLEVVAVPHPDASVP